jgi:signal transduction histidine kinase
VAATAQNDLPLHGFESRPSSVVSDGLLTCHRRDGELIVSHADDRFRRRLELPSLAEVEGEPLLDVLGARLHSSERREVASAVVSARRVAVELDMAGDRSEPASLVLTPTLADGVWVGSLECRLAERELRLESVALTAAQFAQDAGAGMAAGSSVPLVASILDGVRSLIGIRGADGRYLLVNTSMAEFHGVTPNAFVGKTPEQLGLPEQVPIDSRARAATEPMIARDVDLVDATGRSRRFDIAWRYVPAEDRTARYLLEVATETTAADEPARTSDANRALDRGSSGARSYTQDLAHDEAMRLDLVLRSCNLVLIDWNIVTDAIAPSESLAELLELAPQDAPTSAAALARFDHPRDKARIQTELRAHLDGDSDEYYCEYRLRTAKGRVRWVVASGRVIERSQNGAALSYLGTLKDVTDSLETEQELQRQLARAQEAVRISEDLGREVRQLETEIREVSQREHERIGHDLHDGLGQELTGVSLLLKSLEDAIERDAPQLRARVHSVRDMVEQSIATARALAQGLSPVHLDRDGFAGALEQLAVNSESLYGIPVRFSSQCSAQLPADFERAQDLYRIAQEAMRNAARHSGASEIRVNLAVDDERLVMTVEDDGHGMHQAGSVSSGMGLKIMRYRASIVGASLEIGAREGGGTVVRCSLRHLGEG